MSSLADKARGLGLGLKGTVEAAVGKATHNRKLEARGKVTRAKGTAHQKLGEARDAGHRLVDNVKAAVRHDRAP